MNNFLLNEGYEDLNNLFTSGKGSNLYINNKKYLDLSLCAGSHILGITTSFSEIHKCSKIWYFKLRSENKYIVQLFKTLQKIFPKYEKFVFCNSGTEQ